ncbi:GNAT family N-acetyltransferase [Chitinophaga oryzae]|uniref:GNAT family N-acetyltransferase n=1 Tax=Chitinophaga oryzae TaxID=2725414 RepID=A0ABX6LCU6_9BACT|nr:GNAT family N-acetyltransferase [Chitinophaga oryzae]QJB37779.1 GNAT family N-acetyltransferase [Chitinophaga oryzae]
MNSLHNPTTETLMQLHADVLFTYNAAGRMLQANEPWADRGPAPRFFLGLPVTGTPVRRYRDDVPEALVQALEAVVVPEAAAEVPNGAPPQVMQYRQLLQSARWEAGPSFLVPETLIATAPAIHLTTEQIAMIGPEFPWLAQELDIVQPCAAVVQNGQVVSVCRSVRITATAHEAGIDTLAPFRGKGYAAAALALWAARVRDMGALPLYSTSWNNYASRSLARKAGLICYGSTLSVS